MSCIPPGYGIFLFSSAVYDLYRPKWSPDIFREWMRTDQRKNMNHDPQKVLSTQMDLESFFFDAQVTGYESLISGLDLPDPDDRHVLAAARQSECDLIVTWNIRHFPADIVDPFGIDVYNPDEFLIMLFETHPQDFLESVRAVLKKLRNPSYSVDTYLEMRLKDGLANTVSILRQYAHILE